MVALLAASLLYFGSGPSRQGAQFQVNLKGRYPDVPLSQYLRFDTAKKEDYGYIGKLDLFSGGLAGVRLDRRLLTAPGGIDVAPGLFLEPSDRTYQGCVVLWGYESGCGDGESDGSDDEVSPDLLAWIDHGPFVPPAPLTQGRGGRRRGILMHVACIDMNKKMPENMAFKVKPCPDPMLAKLCAIDKLAQPRGTYDQPRIWIYTDNATIEDCNAHLQREITPSIYLHALWEDGAAGALDLSKPGVRKCIDPKLIEGFNSPQEAKVWLVQTLDQINPQGLTHVLESDGPAFQGMFPDDARAANMAGLLDALADSKTPSVVATLPKFIDAAVAADRRDAVLSKCKHKF